MLMLYLKCIRQINVTGSLHESPGSCQLSQATPDIFVYKNTEYSESLEDFFLKTLNFPKPSVWPYCTFG